MSNKKNKTTILQVKALCNPENVWFCVFCIQNEDEVGKKEMNTMGNH